MKPERVFTAVPAAREQVPLLIGLVSPSGGGKTFSSLRLATGIARVCAGPIVVIDTENRRALHYADAFKFMHIPFTPPFGADDYKAAMRYAASQKPSCIIVDSLSHEHVGEGGYLDVAEKEIDRIAGDDYAKRERSKFRGWAKAVPLRTSLIESIKQISGNMIFCWRGKEKTKPVRTMSGKTEVVEQGLMAIGGSEWVYEMTINCLLPPRSNGVPDWTGVDPGERMQMKLPQQFRNLFRDGTVLSEDIGQAMAEWAIGGVRPRVAAESEAPAPLPRPPGREAGASIPDEAGILLRSQLQDALTAAAHKGVAEFRLAWDAARKTWRHQPETKRHFVGLMEHWLAIAQEVDQAQPPDIKDDQRSDA
jgi:hypothetical protein